MSLILSGNTRFFQINVLTLPQLYAANYSLIGIILSIRKKCKTRFPPPDFCTNKTNERWGIRTPDNLIKSQVLYRLS